MSQKICEELRWLFREQSSDFGVDAQVEIADDDILTGKLLGLQIKSGESFFKERTPNTIIYRGDKEHLQYWLNHKLPILIVLYDPATDTAYWEQVTEDRAVDLSVDTYSLCELQLLLKFLVFNDLLLASGVRFFSITVALAEQKASSWPLHGLLCNLLIFKETISTLCERLVS